MSKDNILDIRNVEFKSIRKETHWKSKIMTVVMKEVVWELVEAHTGPDLVWLVRKASNGFYCKRMENY